MSDGSSERRASSLREQLVPGLEALRTICFSDLRQKDLHERGHSSLLATSLARLAHAPAELIISDSGRGNRGRMTHALLAQGYRASEDGRALEIAELAPLRNRVLRFTRSDKFVSVLSTRSSRTGIRH